MKALIFGSLTIDENTGPKGKYIGPGGAVYFVARTYENLGVLPTIVSPYGTDFPKICLPQTRFIPAEPAYVKTLIFKNSYTGSIRKQQVENFDENLTFQFYEKIKDLNLEPDIVIIAPIMQNINYSQISSINRLFPKSFFVFLPQGFYRQINKKGEILRFDREIDSKIIELFDLICFSKDDVEYADRIGKIWSKLGPMVVITQANKDASLYEKGKSLESKPFYVPDVLDPTGAGDIFAAAFGFAFLKSLDKSESLSFAHACAALSLRARSDKLQYTYRDIINFAASQKRPIKL